MNVNDINVENHASGDFIIRNGDPDQGMIVVLEGTIAVYIHVIIVIVENDIYKNSKSCCCWSLFYQFN